MLQWNQYHEGRSKMTDTQKELVRTLFFFVVIVSVIYLIKSITTPPTNNLDNTPYLDLIFDLLISNSLAKLSFEKSDRTHSLISAFIVLIPYITLCCLSLPHWMSITFVYFIFIGIPFLVLSIDSLKGRYEFCEKQSDSLAVTLLPLLFLTEGLGSVFSLIFVMLILGGIVGILFWGWKQLF